MSGHSNDLMKDTSMAGKLKIYFCKSHRTTTGVVFRWIELFLRPGYSQIVKVQAKENLSQIIHQKDMYPVFCGRPEINAGDEVPGYDPHTEKHHTGPV